MAVTTPQAAVHFSWTAAPGEACRRRNGPNAVLFDRDGTLLLDASGRGSSDHGASHHGASHHGGPFDGDRAPVRAVAGARDALDALRDADVRIGVVTDGAARRRTGSAPTSRPRSTGRSNGSSGGSTSGAPARTRRTLAAAAASPSPGSCSTPAPASASIPRAPSSSGTASTTSWRPSPRVRSRSSSRPPRRPPPRSRPRLWSPTRSARPSRSRSGCSCDGVRRRVTHEARDGVRARQSARRARRNGRRGPERARGRPRDGAGAARVRRRCVHPSRTTRPCRTGDGSRGLPGGPPRRRADPPRSPGRRAAARTPDRRAHAEEWRLDRPDLVHAHFWMSGLAAASQAGEAGRPLVQTFHALGVVERRHQGDADTSPAARIPLERALARRGERHRHVPRRGRRARAARRRPARLAVVPVRRRRRALLAATARRAPRPSADRASQRRPARAPQGRRHARRALRHVPATRSSSWPVAPTAATRARPRGACGCAGSPHELRRRRPGDLPRRRRATDVPAAPPSPTSSRTRPGTSRSGSSRSRRWRAGARSSRRRSGGWLDTVVDGATGLLVPPRASRPLAAALRRLLGDPVLLAAMGLAAADRASTRYSWDRVAHETEHVYAAVVRAGVPAASTVATGAGAAPVRWRADPSGPRRDGRVARRPDRPEDGEQPQPVHVRHVER